MAVSWLSLYEEVQEPKWTKLALVDTYAQQNPEISQIYGLELPLLRDRAAFLKRFFFQPALLNIEGLIRLQDKTILPEASAKLSCLVLA